MDLRQLLAQRGIAMDAAGVLAGVDGSTISRICAGQVRARPKTVVKLAKALGTSARRMQALCESHYLAAHPDEAVAGAADVMALRGAGPEMAAVAPAPGGGECVPA